MSTQNGAILSRSSPKTAASTTLSRLWGCLGLQSPISRLTSVALAGLLLTLGGCAFQQHREQLATLHATGRDRDALALLNEPATIKLYGPQDQLLYLLDHGSLLLESGNAVQAIAELEQADAIMDSPSGSKNAGDELAQWLINDTAAAYIGEPYESIYVNVIKLCAQLDRTDEGSRFGAKGSGLQGVISGGATVEARRAASKADRLRDKYASTQAALGDEARKRGGDIDNASAATDPSIKAAPPAVAGQFIESTLGDYLSAITFMKSAEPEAQDVAARRLTDAIAKQGSLIGNVKAESFSSLGELNPADVNVLLVAFSGVGPTKYAERVGPIPIGTWPVYFELPMLRIQPSSVVSVRATLTPHEPTEANPPQVVELSLIENMARVAEENHRRQLPQIYARTLIRATIRSGASFAATQALKSSASSQNKDAVAFAATLGGLIALAALERADLRCWIFLPGQAHVALAKLPEGMFDAKVEYLDAAGRIIDTKNAVNLNATSGPAALATALTYSTR